MVELEDLREILRAREALAPEPEDVIAGADRRFRRVRARRRVAGAAAAVVVITAGLSVGLGLARQHGSAPAPPLQAAAAPSDTTVAPSSALPFTVVTKGDQAELVSWTLTDHGVRADYSLDGQDYQVTLNDIDPEAGYGTLPKATFEVNGARATLLYPEGSKTQQLSWLVAPGKWASVLTDNRYVSPGEIVAFGNAIRPTPDPVPTLIHTLRMPAGLAVAGRRGTASEDTVVLCSAGSVPDGIAGKMRDCVSVIAESGFLAQQRQATRSPGPASDRQVVVDGVELGVSADGRSVVRQFPGWSLEVQRLEGDPSILPAIAASVTMK